MGVHYVDQNISSEQKKELLNKIKIIIRSHIARQLDCEIIVELATDKKVAYQLMNILHEDVTDIIVMQRHHKKILEKLFIGSEARRMLELFQGNLLILPI
jgi:predicted site-specific integrase-resolvase